MDQVSRLEWPDIKAVAEDAFNVWVDQPELIWAQAAWAALGEAGLTSYRDEFERCLVAMRFVGLASLYRDFCEVAWDLSWVPEDKVAYWAEELGVTPVAAGCLAGQMGFDPREWVDDLENRRAFEIAVFMFLAYEARPHLVSSLKQKWGQKAPVRGIHMVLVTLWRSRSHPEQEDDEDWDESEPDGDTDAPNEHNSRVAPKPKHETPDITAEDSVGYEAAVWILNEADDERMKAYTWLVDAGAEPLHGVRTKLTV